MSSIKTRNTVMPAQAGIWSVAATILARATGAIPAQAGTLALLTSPVPQTKPVAAVPAQAGTTALQTLPKNNAHPHSRFMLAQAGIRAILMALVWALPFAHAQPTNPFPACKLAATCGQMAAYSCPGSRMFYADAATHKLTATCPHECTDFKREWCESNCPPKGWTCPKPEPVK